MTVTCIRDQGDFPILVIPHDPLRSLSEENYITSKGGATIGGNMLQYQLTVGREYTVFSVLFFEHNKDKKGTGLGLSISKTIVNKLEGQIGADSVEGKGSTFWFTIPYRTCGRPE